MANTTVNVVTIGGAQGIPGPPPVTILTANFTMPAVGLSAIATVASTLSFVVGQTVVMVGAGSLAVASVNSATSMSLTNAGAFGNAIYGTVIDPGAQVGLGGTPGGYPVTTLGANFTMPEVGDTAPATVGSTQWMTVGASLYLQGAGSLIVTAIGSTTSCTLQNPSPAVSSNASPSTVIDAGATLGVTSGTGQYPVTILTANFTMPNVGSTASASLANTGWMVASQYVTVAGLGTLFAVSVTSGTAAVLQNPSPAIGSNASPGTVADSGSAVGLASFSTSALASVSVTTSTYEIQPTNDILSCRPPSGGQTLTMPSPAARLAVQRSPLYAFDAAGAAAENNMTFLPNGEESFYAGGVALTEYIVNTNGGSVQIVTDESGDWYIL